MYIGYYILVLNWEVGDTMGRNGERWAVVGRKMDGVEQRKILVRGR